MRAGIKITFQDNTSAEVVALVPDFVAWERHSKRKTSDLSNGIGVEDLAFLGWSALKRSEPQAAFEKWIETVAEIEMGSTEPPKATRRDQSADS